MSSEYTLRVFSLSPKSGYVIRNKLRDIFNNFTINPSKVTLIPQCSTDETDDLISVMEHIQKYLEKYPATGVETVRDPEIFEELKYETAASKHPYYHNKDTFDVYVGLLPRGVDRIRITLEQH